jgi:hypothetical protein
VKRIFVCVVLILGLFPLARGAGYDSDNYRRTKPFMDGMLNMMDRMGVIDLDDYPDQTGSDYDWASSSRSRQTFNGFPAYPYPPGAVPRIPAQLMPPRPRSPVSSLDGVWQGRSGEILMIRDGRFRIYVTRERYRRGKLRIRGKILYMHNPNTNTTNKYEYATQKGRLALRDTEGHLLLYRRLQNR